MDWQEEYKDKIVSAEEAMKVIKSGDRITPGGFCGEPLALLAALAERAKELSDLEIVAGGNFGPEPYLGPGMDAHIRLNSLCGAGESRKALDERRADYTPTYFSDFPRLFKPDGPLPIDVALISLSWPDENGECSFGVTVDHTCYLVNDAKTVIAQINRNMPWTFDMKVKLSDVDRIVIKEEPIVELPYLDPSELGDVEWAIGKYIAELIPDGATLQIGQGKIPDAVTYSLKGKKDIGIHSELMTNGLMRLMQTGVATNRLKTTYPGKTVCTFAAGDRELYQWIDNNKDIVMLPVDVVNDPWLIGRNNHMVSVNSALQIDLAGQVSADMIGHRQYSGPGGQVDFVRGARRCPNGKAIIALTSTAAGGKFSRIVPFPSQSGVVDTRFDVDYVVTEYGVAKLWGRTNRERVKALIRIAHPKFRNELEERAKADGWLW